jgi:hypothetical protein
MTENRTVTVAGRKYSVPPLPFRVNREVYPICRKLNNGGLVERAIQAMGALDCTMEEMDDLAQVTFLSVRSVDPDLTREEFDGLAFTPPELIDAYFVIRALTGGWVDLPPATTEAPSGEAKGSPAPRKSRRRK